ncbi:L,D-transpeptidase [Microvirga thermotolerans]|uniref:L,D-transpeptidase family protein n=1 Tax=Microvirga thermotolerans TaxID=2651334 RepID=A0A5P9K0U6_9HYPH|nr:L,D-transpeptidase [Microvirga thermotolerans]QFU15844.1 L,D-transpeptidase family protein [Microvirga thermotolerans]
MILRRLLPCALLSASLAACQSVQTPPQASAEADPYAGWYIGLAPDKPYDIPLVDRSRMDAKYARQVVEYKGPEKPGSIVVDIDERMLYLVQPDNKAIRYGVGVGRQGFSWKGVASVGRKGVWPAWSPTKTMVSLKPDLPRYREAGLDNPLGARALYLYQDGRDILFRIHGTNEPWSIGQQVSSGCIRMLNEDIVDLYERVPVGATVYVKRNGRYRV